MNVQRILHAVDGVSTWVGKAAAWLIIGLMALVCVEVFKRYILNMPTAWIFDASNMFYGSLFMLAGAYTPGAERPCARRLSLQLDAARERRPRFDLVLYIVFFLPGIAALIYAGYDYARLSWRIGEHSTVTANGPPIYHFKAVIPVAGALLMLQGFAEILRCVVCLKTGRWPSRLKDVAEIDVVEEQLAQSEYVDEETRKTAIARAQQIDESGASARDGGRPAVMSDPALGLTMLMLIVVVIMMGFPTAFTLMGLGMFFGFYAFYNPAEHWFDNRVFDLMVQRTYGAMTNDVLISIPLFVLMGYVMERGALVDKMFYSIQLSFRRVPASLAVATLIVCTFWGIASGLVGAVVVLMGVIAFNPMLRAGYDVKLASGVITAGGTLGILIPPSVMIIVYAAVAGQSVVKLYAAAMFPGFFLALLYLVYIVGWAMLNPKIAPALPGGADARSGAGLDAQVPGSLLARTCWSGLSAALFSPAKAMTIETATGPAHLLDARSRISARRSIPFALTALHPVAAVVVRRDPSAGRATGEAPEGLEQLGSPVVSDAPPAAPMPARRRASTSPSRIIAVLAAVILLRYYRQA